MSAPKVVAHDAITGAGGSFGKLTRIFYDDDTTRVVKETHAEREHIAIELGTAREAFFYAHSMDDAAIAGLIPKCYATGGDMATGRKHIVLEDIDGRQGGLYFGRGSPLNWVKQLPEDGPSAVEVTRASFAALAHLHRHFWGKQFDWAETDSDGLTLIHGDFFPANVMVRRDQSIVIVDWEMCRFGRPGVDLAQWVISHMEPSLRRSCELELLRDYHAVLNVKEYTFDELVTDYQKGGLLKWKKLLVQLP